MCGCVPPPNDGTVQMKAVVRATSNLDCTNKVELLFEDTEAIHQLTHSSSDIAVLDNFPVHLTIQGQKVWVKVRALKPGEDFPCTTLGTPYPHVKFVGADARD